MEETCVCDHCGEEFPRSLLFELDGQQLCETCVEEDTLLCEACGTRIWRDENAGNEDIPLCQSCYDRHYTTCETCGRLLHNDDVYYDGEEDGVALCCHCYEQSMGHRAIIQDYSYKPQPVFYGEGTRYFGVELEVDGAGESPRNAEAVLALANQRETLLYCKHDGSLDDGFELVTHPMTLAFHQKDMPWADVLKLTAALGYRSHQAGTCGLHIHVNRTTFGCTEEEQDGGIARVLYFFEKHWEELLKFSRRTESQLRRWAARYGYKEQPREILYHAKKGYGGGRYTCVNLQNVDTVEFRMFRGTLRTNTLIATLQLVNRICDRALALSDEEIKGLSWTGFVASVREPELIQYLKERRLYVNEPLEGEAEL